MKDKFEIAMERKDMLCGEYNIPSSCIVETGKDQFDFMKSKVVFRVQFANRNSTEIKQTSAIIAYRYQIKETYVGNNFTCGYVYDIREQTEYEFTTTQLRGYPIHDRQIQVTHSDDIRVWFGGTFHHDKRFNRYEGDEYYEGIYNAIVEYYKIKEA